MALFQLTGAIKVLTPTASITTKSGNQYAKRELVLDCSTYNPADGTPRPNFPKIEFGGQKCEQLDNYQVGQRITVKFAVRGVMYEKDGQTRYFTTIEGVEVQPAQQAAYQPAPQQYQPQQYAQPAPPQPAPQYPPQQPVPQQYTQPAPAPQYPPQPATPYVQQSGIPF